MKAPTADRQSFTINSSYEINLGNAQDTNSSVYLLQKVMKYLDYIRVNNEHTIYNMASNL